MFLLNTSTITSDDFSLPVIAQENPTLWVNTEGVSSHPEMYWSVGSTDSQDSLPGEHSSCVYKYNRHIFWIKKNEDASSSICPDNKIEYVISALSIKFIVHFNLCVKAVWGIGKSKAQVFSSLFAFYNRKENKKKNK